MKRENNTEFLINVFHYFTWKHLIPTILLPPPHAILVVIVCVCVCVEILE